MDKLQIIERYNHRTKRCCVLSQDDGTSSSDRRAIECPKAGNFRKTRQCAHRSPSDCWYCSGRVAGTASTADPASIGGFVSYDRLQLELLLYPKSQANETVGPYRARIRALYASASARDPKPASFQPGVGGGASGSR